jgi:hypothetical protein
MISVTEKGLHHLKSNVVFWLLKPRYEKVIREIVITCDECHHLGKEGEKNYCIEGVFSTSDEKDTGKKWICPVVYDEVLARKGIKILGASDSLMKLREKGIKMIVDSGLKSKLDEIVSRKNSVRFLSMMDSLAGKPDGEWEKCLSVIISLIKKTPRITDELIAMIVEKLRERDEKE